MKYLGYSELTKRIYILPASKKAAKVDITEDIKELMAFFKKDTFSILSDQITALQSQCTENEKEISGYKKVIELKNDEITGYKKELKEKEKECEELKKKVNDLTMDNMTHEYNQAEAERTWPQFKQQIIDEWKTENNL